MLSPTLSTWFIALHEALQASTGKVDLIHMIGHAHAIETGELSVPMYSVPVRSYRRFRHVRHAHRHLLGHYRDLCWEPDSRWSVHQIEWDMFKCNQKWVLGHWCHVRDVRDVHHASERIREL